VPGLATASGGPLRFPGLDLVKRVAREEGWGRIKRGQTLTFGGGDASSDCHVMTGTHSGVPPGITSLTRASSGAACEGKIIFLASMVRGLSTECNQPERGMEARDFGREEDFLAGPISGLLDP